MLAITISQLGAGTPAGVVGESRDDIDATENPATPGYAWPITVAVSGLPTDATVARVVIAARPPGSNPQISQTAFLGPSCGATITFAAGVYGVFLFDVEVSRASGAKRRLTTRLTAVIPSPLLGLLEPAINESYSPHASLLMATSAIRSLTSSTRLVNGIFAGPQAIWRQIIEALEALAAGGGGGAVSSVAGRTGAVVLSSSDVSGLGSAALASSSAFDAAGTGAAAQAAAIAAAVALVDDLSGVTNAAAARGNLGLGSAAQQSSGAFDAAGTAAASASAAQAAAIAAAAALVDDLSGVANASSARANLGLGATDAVTHGRVTANKFTPVTLDVAYAASLTLDVSLNNDFAIGTLTGNCAITLSGFADNDAVQIDVVQDGVGTRTVSFTVAGRTQKLGISTANLTAATGAGAITRYNARFRTYAGIACVVWDKGALT